MLNAAAVCVRPQGPQNGPRSPGRAKVRRLPFLPRSSHNSAGTAVKPDPGPFLAPGPLEPPAPSPGIEAAQVSPACHLGRVLPLTF